MYLTKEKRHLFIKVLKRSCAGPLLKAPSVCFHKWIIIAVLSRKNISYTSPWPFPIFYDSWCSSILWWNSRKELTSVLRTGLLTKKWLASHEMHEPLLPQPCLRCLGTHQTYCSRKRKLKLRRKHLSDHLSLQIQLTRSATNVDPVRTDPMATMSISVVWDGVAWKRARPSARILL